jgi:hypothetical protein
MSKSTTKPSNAAATAIEKFKQHRISPIKSVAQDQIELPQFIVFKRTAVRNFPNAQAVGEYWSDETQTGIMFPISFVKDEA